MNWSPPEQNGCHFAYYTFKCIYMTEFFFFILIQISQKFVSKDPIDKKPALVQVIAWCRLGNKALPDSMLTQFIDTCMQH